MSVTRGTINSVHLPDTLNLNFYLTVYHFLGILLIFNTYECLYIIRVRVFNVKLFILKYYLQKFLTLYFGVNNVL